MIEHIYKVVLLGECNSGKSSFLNRIIYSATEKPDHLFILPEKSITVGTCFAALELDKDHRVHIWDTGGEEKSKLHIYTKDSDAVVLMFDINNITAFNETKTYWIKYIEEYFNYHLIYNKTTSYKVCSCAPVVVVLGNKIDMSNEDSCNFNTFVNSFINDLKLNDNVLTQSIIYFPISVKTGYNVNNAFKYIIDSLETRESEKCPFKESSDYNNKISNKTSNKTSNKKCKLYCFN